MYTPKETVPSAQPLIRLGLQGEPGSGKTTSMLTFPGIIVADFDHKLPAGTQSIPFWNDDFIYTLIPRRGNGPPNRRDAFKKWLRENYAKFEPDQTFGVDSWTMLQGAFDRQTILEPVLTKTGEVDKFAFWQHKLVYSREICEMLQVMNCNVVVTFHDQRERDEQGNLTGKFKPLQQGSFADAVAGYFTSWFGQLSRDEKRKEMPDKYVWQVRSNAIRFCNIDVRIPRELAFVEAGYESYLALRKEFGMKE